MRLGACSVLDDATSLELFATDDLGEALETLVLAFEAVDADALSPDLLIVEFVDTGEELALTGMVGLIVPDLALD